jgi:hypothetical protein
VSVSTRRTDPPAPGASNLFTDAQLAQLRQIVREELAAQWPDPAAIRAVLDRIAQRTADGHTRGSALVAPEALVAPDPPASQAS